MSNLDQTLKEMMTVGAAVVDYNSGMGLGSAVAMRLAEDGLAVAVNARHGDSPDSPVFVPIRVQP